MSVARSLTAPAVMPRTMYFWMKTLAISSGTIVTTPTVAATSQSIGRWALISPAAPIGIVFWSSELIRYRPTRNSFQMKMLEKIAATRIPGRTSGRSTLSSVPHGPHPSRAAAASMSRGTSSKKPIMIQMTSGRLKAT